MPSPSRPDARLVCLDDDLCGFIYTALALAYPKDTAGKADVFHRAWKAAPADPVEAVLNELEAVGVHVIGATTAVLAALGFAGEATP